MLGSRSSRHFLVSAVAVAACCSLLRAGGGGAENILLIVDPSSPESMYIGNYYKNARKIPDCNVLYMPPVACNFENHRTYQLKALLGELRGRQLSNHIDYVVIPPGSSYYMNASGYVQDSCSPVNRFSASAAYTMSYIADEVAEGVQMLHDNFYYGQPGATDTAIAFDGGTPWFLGIPLDDDSLPRYLIGAMLGYSGQRGNHVQEIIDMIDRSVAADGIRPDGTFYFMETTDNLRSGPRDDFFNDVVAEIENNGGVAEHLMGVLPEGRHDCLGVMTGWASPAIDSTDMTLLPGAFCDHLTSYAARFDTGSQVKVSKWISKGASGSYGAVEEPCNYPGKFPHARVHRYYHEGLSLGEAVFRSVEYFPFQMLLYGDPITAPFAHLPIVEVPDAPNDTIAGKFALSPVASTSHPTAAIGRYELYVDGRLEAEAAPGQSFLVDSARWSDGAHELRVVAYDDTPIVSAGRWIRTITSSNHGRNVELAFQGNVKGSSNGTFTFAATANGGDVAEMRLVSSSRVLAAAQDSDTAVWSLPGAYLGAGPSEVHVVAEFLDGRQAVSNRIKLTIDNGPEGEGSRGSREPEAFSYIKSIPLNQPCLVELPAFTPDGSHLTYSLVERPSQAIVVGEGGPTVLVVPDADASGNDTLTFRVANEDQDVALATVVLSYGFKAGDWDEDGDLDLADYAAFQQCFNTEGVAGVEQFACQQAFDWDADEASGQNDFATFVALVTGPKKTTVPD